MTMVKDCVDLHNPGGESLSKISIHCSGLSLGKRRQPYILNPSLNLDFLKRHCSFSFSFFWVFLEENGWICQTYCCFMSLEG